MIILNLLNRIFGHRGSLSRDEISSYQKKRNLHDVEAKSLANDFDSDALDGWTENDIPVENMSDLDKKFNSKFNTPNWSSSTVLFFTLFFLASGAILTFTYTSNKNNQIQAAEAKQNKQPFIALSSESIEYNSNEEDKIINSFEAVPKEKEVQPSSLKRLVSAIESENTDTLHDENISQTTHTIYPEVQTNIPVVGNSKTLVYNLVDEFYLHDFKLIDYRKFRDAPIKKRKLVPVGTPADQEYYDNENSEDFVWKEVDISYVDFLNESMEFFEKSNYKKALKRFNTILNTYEDDINAHFYGGLCYYNLGQYEKAIDHFDQSYDLELGNFRQEALWFKAKAFVEMNEIERANELLNRIASESKFYSKDAIDLLKIINRD
jgi:tetratricopeptide (TPR) repeat protein